MIFSQREALLENRPLSINRISAFIFILLGSAACRAPVQPATPVPSSNSVQSTQRPATENASDTPVEVAANVNGELISLETYQASLARYQEAIDEVGTILATDSPSRRVLDDLINRQLLSQAARQADFTADENMVNQRLLELTEKAGGQDALSGWMTSNHYAPESFRQELALEMEAAWMRDQIIMAVPETAEQIRARQVLFYTSFEAERVYAQLQNGAPFDIIVRNNDPQDLGYLDWFPRGYLLNPELEEAAFSLQPGQYSQVIETSLGFHILEVLDYDPNRQLSLDALLLFQSRILQQWLEERWTQSDIEIIVP